MIRQRDPAPPSPEYKVEPNIQETEAFLTSESALQSIERDPYWPKWDSPWWHMSLLNEMDLAERIPRVAVAKMVQTLKGHYLPFFPIKEEEIPNGIDPVRKVACFCAIGSMYQILFNCGVAVDDELPWMRKFLLRYQLPDGGLNCDEQVYSSLSPKSSIVSTLPCLEAILFSRSRDLTPDEVEYLNRGANYLVRQKLFRRISTGEVINPDWLEIRFPRFYDYDFFRGFYFLARWRAHSGFDIPKELEMEVQDLVSRQMTDEGIRLMRYNLISKRSYNPVANGAWTMGEATEFPLMKSVSFAGCHCESLTKKWYEVKP